MEVCVARRMAQRGFARRRCVAPRADGKRLPGLAASQVEELRPQQVPAEGLADLRQGGLAEGRGTHATFSGPETGKRTRLTREADAFGYPFQLTHFS